jgi:hypothetical protein
MEEQNHIIDIIKKKVQLGGDASLRRFNSFGPQVEVLSSSDNCGDAMNKSEVNNLR